MRTTVAFALLAVLVTSLLHAAPAALPEVVTLAVDAELATPLAGKEVLYADGDNKLWLLDASTGQRQVWLCDWKPQDDGWDKSGRISVLTASPDGQCVCFAQNVGASIAKLAGGKPVDGILQGQEEIWAVAVVLARADGSGARAVALGQEAGGGPEYDFTKDSERLVGQPFMPCLPDAQHCYEYGSVIWEVPPIERFNYIDVASGERGWIADLPVSDGYWKCPYSDYFRAENNDYDVHEFSTFSGGGIIGRYTCPPPGQGQMHGWVLEDAVLLSQSAGQGLLYVDGTFKQAPKPGWEIYCWLPDGSYIFSDDAGASVKFGKVDWSSFSVDWYVPRPDLAEYKDALWQALPDASGVLIQPWYSTELFYAPVSREGSKP